MGVEELISEKDYEKSNSIINDFYTDSNKFNLDDLSLIKDLLIKVIDKSEERFFLNSPEIYSLVNELKNQKLIMLGFLKHNKKLSSYLSLINFKKCFQENLNKFFRFKNT